MIAVGIALFVLGTLITNLLGSHYRNTHNGWDYLAGVMALLGLSSGTMGAVIWAWQYLP